MKNVYGETALYLACKYCQLSILELLLKNRSIKKEILHECLDKFKSHRNIADLTKSN